MDSRVTIHMAASLDGRVDWMETADEFAGGEDLEPGFVEAFLQTIDCYVMGSRTYETALDFEAKGFSRVAIYRDPGRPSDSTPATWCGS